MAPFASSVCSSRVLPLASRAVEIVDAVGDVRGLLDLGDERPRADRSAHVPRAGKTRSPGAILNSRHRASVRDDVVPDAGRSYSAGVTCFREARTQVRALIRRHHVPHFGLAVLAICGVPMPATSFGCTWIERSCRASMNLISSGNSVAETARSWLCPNSAAPWRCPISSGRVDVPAYSGPSATTDSLSLTPDKLPAFADVATGRWRFPCKGAIFSPPQISAFEERGEI